MMAVDADPKLVPARVKLGSLYFFGQAYDQAEEQAKAATALAPDDPDVHVLNARLLLQKKEKEAGIKELDAALAKNPDLVDAILLRAAVTSISDPAAGLKILDDAIARLDKDKAKSLRQVRIALLAQQNRTERRRAGLPRPDQGLPEGRGVPVPARPLLREPGPRGRRREGDAQRRRAGPERRRLAPRPRPVPGPDAQPRGRREGARGVRRGEPEPAGTARRPSAGSTRRTTSPTRRSPCTRNSASAIRSPRPASPRACAWRR